MNDSHKSEKNLKRKITSRIDRSNENLPLAARDEIAREMEEVRLENNEFQADSVKFAPWFLLPFLLFARFLPRKMRARVYYPSIADLIVDYRDPSRGQQSYRNVRLMLRAIRDAWSACRISITNRDLWNSKLTKESIGIISVDLSNLVEHGRVFPPNLRRKINETRGIDPDVVVKPLGDFFAVENQHVPDMNDQKLSDRICQADWMTSLAATSGVIVIGVILVWVGPRESVDVETKLEASCQVLLQGRESPVFALAWSNDNSKLAVSGFGPIVKIWDRESGRMHSIEGRTDQPRFVLGWSDDGRRVVLGGFEKPVEAWDEVVDENGKVRVVTTPDDRPATVRMISEASRGSPIRVRGAANRRPEWLPASDHAAISAAFSPDGHSIVTAESDQRVRVWDAESGRLLHMLLTVEPRGISCVAFSPNNSKIATCGGGALRLWDTATGAPLATLGEENGGSAVLSFSPDGTMLAVASWDGNIRIWDLSSGLERAKLPGHDGQVLALAWSPDGARLASGGYDSTVQIWNMVKLVKMAKAD